MISMYLLKGNYDAHGRRVSYSLVKYGQWERVFSCIRTNNMGVSIYGKLFMYCGTIYIILFGSPGQYELCTISEDGKNISSLGCWKCGMISHDTSFIRCNIRIECSQIYASDGVVYVNYYDISVYRIEPINSVVSVVDDFTMYKKGITIDNVGKLRIYHVNIASDTAIIYSGDYMQLTSDHYDFKSVIMGDHGIVYAYRRRELVTFSPDGSYAKTKFQISPSDTGADQVLQLSRNVHAFVSKKQSAIMLWNTSDDSRYGLPLEDGEYVIIPGSFCVDISILAMRIKHSLISTPGSSVAKNLNDLTWITMVYLYADKSGRWWLRMSANCSNCG